MKKIILSLSVILILSSCALAGKSNINKESLASTSALYYKLLMWKYYDKSSLLVEESKRARYEKFVQSEGESLNVTSYEIKEITVAESQTEEARVRVFLNYYKYPSVSEKNTVLDDTWIQTKDGWRVSPDFDKEPFK